ncbi:type VII secretion target [Nocardia sp. NBC_00565]|uniref:type VII secretion target n=1 Tax=Nocardia sp. NBC_00565 TaxID=2975993 RepID=UPI002E81A408|nr:type VII secretion target [Nocardia sp. NBC_00565]WUC01148.1 type VII secretion target [Nocardia sp. NBC_00565]
MVEKMDPKTLQVDTGALQTFAGNLRTEAGNVGKLNAGDGFGVAATALPGTAFGTVIPEATDVVNRCLQRIGDRLTAIADNVKNAAGKYEVAEDEFATKLRTIGLQQS